MEIKQLNGNREGGPLQGDDLLSPRHGQQNRCEQFTELAKAAGNAGQAEMRATGTPNNPGVQEGVANGSVSLAGAQFPPRPERMAFSVQETAGLLGVSEKTVRRLVARRLLCPSRALRHLLIARREIERFLQETTIR